MFSQGWSLLNLAGIESLPLSRFKLYWIIWLGVYWRMKKGMSHAISGLGWLGRLNGWTFLLV